MKDCIVKDYTDYFKGENQFDYVDTETFTTGNGSEVKVKYSVSNRSHKVTTSMQ